MENTLQIIEINGIQTVSARELYKGLEISWRFSEWWKSNSKDFVENEDFTSVGKTTLVNNGAEREIQDYAISIDMAKAICLMSRTEIGKKYRTYLISLEKAWNNPEMVMKRALEYANKRAEQLYLECQIMQPKADVYDQLVDRSKCINFRDFASKIGFTQNEFMTILKSKYIYKNSVGEYRAYSEYQKYFTLRTFAKGVDKTGEQLMLNMDGITYFTEKYKPGAVAESFIEKSEGEYQKIVNETADKFIQKDLMQKAILNTLPVPKGYSFELVAKLAGESVETILNYCKLQKYVDDFGNPTMFGTDITKYFTRYGAITENGKNAIVSVFAQIRSSEKGMKSSSIGKAE